jgi:beta-lactam-binding protein with PASTA domain/alpha-tubulin suppressor-like RCC1 family protein
MEQLARTNQNTGKRCTFQKTSLLRTLLLPLSMFLIVVAAQPSWGHVVAPSSDRDQKDVMVPAVIDLTRHEARKELREADLELGRIARESSSTVTEGHIISQDPAPHTEVRRYSRVDVVISKGPTTLEGTIPNVVGSTQATATAAIIGAGLVVGTVTTQSSATVAAGLVISESPVAGTSVTSGSAVNLVVSSGAAKVAVPNVVGATQAAATSAITGAGLVVGTVTTQSSATVATGLVISESPVAGTSVATGSAVNLVVSSGAAKVTVPNVVGATQAAATTAITGSGLVLGTVTTQTSTTVAAGLVMSETPTAGTSVASGSAVNLVVSSDVAKVAVPNVVGATQAAATTAITGSGLVLGTVTTQSSTTVAAGLVISESPAAGASVASGSSVNLVVSSGSGGSATPMVSVGDGFACALNSAGAVYCWGIGGQGQVGNSTVTTFIDSPIPVVGLPAATAISAGYYHTCAITGGGTPMCWGYNLYGELGNGATTSNPTFAPVAVSGLTGVVSISAGIFHTCAVTQVGGVWCWGYNNEGQLGNGTKTDSSIPVPVTNLSSGVVSVSAGEYYTCAVTAVGAVWCWGENSDNQFGDAGLPTSTTVPVQVLNSTGSGPLTGISAVSAGTYGTCAVTTTKGALCWGLTIIQGNGNALSDYPVMVSGLSSGVTSISSGGEPYACAAAAGTASCWGQSGEALGNDTTEDELTPVAVVGPTNVVSVSAGFMSACALTNSGAVWCWGNNSNGELGDGTNSVDANGTPVQVVAVIGGGFLQL